MDQGEVWIDEDGEEYRICEMTEEELYEALDVLDAHIDELHYIYAEWERAQIVANSKTSWFLVSFFSRLGVLTVTATDPEVWMDSTALYRGLLKAYKAV
jgi:hypothetical protein